MKLFDLLKKTSDEDIRELEIYSGMRVIVETPSEDILFVAKLQDPHKNTAELYQYSAANDIQDIMAGHVPVIIRGYNERERKAVFMEGNMSPKEDHVWQAEDLVITKIENERAFSRFSTDIAATVTADDGTNAGEKACKLLNISIGGANIESEYRYYKGDRFLLKARLVGDRPVSVMYCEVLRVTEKAASRFEYGCRFLELTKADQEMLSQNLALLEKNPAH